MSLVRQPPRIGNFKDRTRPKIKTERRFVDKRHTDFIKTLPCVYPLEFLIGIQLTAHEGPMDAHHLLRVPTNERGGAMKSGDCWTVPLCRAHHEALHADGDEVGFLRRVGIYGPGLAALLFQLSGNEPACIRAIKESRS